MLVCLSPGGSMEPLHSKLFKQCLISFPWNFSGGVDVGVVEAGGGGHEMFMLLPLNLSVWTNIWAERNSIPLIIFDSLSRVVSVLDEKPNASDEKLVRLHGLWSSDAEGLG